MRTFVTGIPVWADNPEDLLSIYDFLFDFSKISQDIEKVFSELTPNKESYEVYRKMVTDWVVLDWWVSSLMTSGLQNQLGRVINGSIHPSKAMEEIYLAMSQVLEQLARLVQ